MSEHCVDAALYWTPQQAEAIADYLEKLQESIWEIYGDEIASQQNRRDLQARCALAQQHTIPEHAPISTSTIASKNEDKKTVSERPANAHGDYRALDSNARYALNCINQTLRRSDSASLSCLQQERSSSSHHRTESSLLPAFDQLPSLSDENIGDVLNYLLAMVGTFEEHYADPLRRLREKHFLEECGDTDEQQLDLPIAPHDGIKF